ncbi:MAG: FkbM family methyltransferase [Deltaproteobacteria bacterium]|nr:FkbM family methyltransferase [Deltaproteobacteria bacterium]
MGFFRDINRFVNEKKRGMLSSLFFGKSRWQRTFEYLYRISLKGMNIGLGPSLADSGEVGVIRRVAAKVTAPGGAVLFDVGANEGEYSRLLVSHFPGDSRIYAFEPSKRTFERLTAAVKDLPTVTCHNAGLGSIKGTLTLHYNIDGSDQASVHGKRSGQAGEVSETVTITTIDAFCRDNGIKKIDFMKIDVEGHELEVLKGAASMLEANAIDYIQFEFGKPNIESRTFFRDFYDMLSPRYEIYRVLKDGVRRIDRYRELHEVFVVVTNFLAVRKNLSI